MKETTVRFSEAPFYSPGTEITLGGIGGIGSYLSLFLSRLECKMITYEYDIIDEPNIGGQLYSYNQVGKSKFEASKFNNDMFCKGTNMINLGKFQSSSFVTPICFSAFDNMAARKLMFEKWSALENREIFIDGRMLLQSGQIYIVTKGLEKKYESTLFNDNEVQDQPCSAKATTHSGALIAAIMTGAFTNYITMKKDPDFILELPFKTTYDIPLFEFMTYENL
jgi:hypothetical protein